MNMQVRVVSADDWAIFREIRLRALADSPDAFGITLAQATAQDEAAWRERATGPGPTILAFDDDQPVAMGGLYTPDDCDDAFVWGIWVEPQWRGTGLGNRLLRELLDHADREDRPAILHVADGNGARRLYEKNGFVATGEWQPLRDGSEVRMETMRRA